MSGEGENVKITLSKGGARPEGSPGGWRWHVTGHMHGYSHTLFGAWVRASRIARLQRKGLL